jgi:hypothetical protein
MASLAGGLPDRRHHPLPETANGHALRAGTPHFTRKSAIGLDRDQLDKDKSMDFRHRRRGGAACRAGDLKRNPHGNRQTHPLTTVAQSGFELGVESISKID